MDIDYPLFTILQLWQDSPYGSVWSVGVKNKFDHQWLDRPDKEH